MDNGRSLPYGICKTPRLWAGKRLGQDSSPRSPVGHVPWQRPFSCRSFCSPPLWASRDTLMGKNDKIIKFTFQSYLQCIRFNSEQNFDPNASPLMEKKYRRAFNTLEYHLSSRQALFQDYLQLFSNYSRSNQHHSLQHFASPLLFTQSHRDHRLLD